MHYQPHHVAITVRNLDKSLEFYQALGYRQVHRYEEPDGSMSIVHLKLGGSFLELFDFKAERDELPLQYDRAKGIGLKHFALTTDDLEAALRDLQQKGLAGPDTEITVGRTKVRYFFIQDPDGVWVEIVKDDRYS